VHGRCANLSRSCHRGVRGLALASTAALVGVRISRAASLDINGANCRNLSLRAWLVEFSVVAILDFDVGCLLIVSLAHACPRNMRRLQALLAAHAHAYSSNRMQHENDAA
jgi:hypothetical protein